MKQYDLGFIACGARNSVYARNLRRQYGDQIHLSAVCDANPQTAEEFKQKFGQPDTVIYTDFREMITKRRESLDGVLIAPPNHLHEEPAVMAFENNIHTLLEKPVAHSPESCMRIARAYDKSASRVTVGFVLRYTPFYRTVTQMVREGKVGRIKSLVADEVVGPVLSSVFFRTWRGSKEDTGDLLLEKTCHDLDLINSILGVNPVRASAFGFNDHYRPVPGLGPRCRDCADKETCAYSTVLWAKSVDQGLENGEYEYIDFSDDKCVYNADHDVMDRQAQIIEYEGNILVSFNVALGGPVTRRSIDITGTEGRLIGDFRQNRIFFYPMGRETEPDEIEITHEASGHGGGDSVITRSFIESLDNPDFVGEAGLKDGLKSAMLAFLCDQARDMGRALPVTYLEEIESIRD